ncbi:hypothetical protein TNCV_3027241 [Trichonephila clavipes]|nr:hypothetical protein TNCV_3027241 [Trichonephila clavipes]
MRARAYCAHPSACDHRALRSMSRCHNQVVSLKRDSQCLSTQASLVLIYRPTAVNAKICKKAVSTCLFSIDSSMPGCPTQMTLQATSKEHYNLADRT